MLCIRAAEAKSGHALRARQGGIAEDLLQVRVRHRFCLRPVLAPAVRRRLALLEHVGLLGVSLSSKAADHRDREKMLHIAPPFLPFGHTSRARAMPMCPKGRDVPKNTKTALSLDGVIIYQTTAFVNTPRPYPFYGLFPSVFRIFSGVATTYPTAVRCDVLLDAPRGRRSCIIPQNSKVPSLRRTYTG